MYEYAFVRGSFIDVQVKVSELSQSDWRVVGLTSNYDSQVFVAMERERLKAKDDTIIICNRPDLTLHALLSDEVSRIRCTTPRP
jgi:hypothetical protein